MIKKNVFAALTGILLLFAVVQKAHAVWVPDGVQIAPYQLPIPSQSPVLAPDGTDGAIIVWADDRNGSRDIYAQRSDSSGIELWTVGGEPICTATGLQEFPRIISDGTGGAIIVWEDARAGNFDIYAQRINASGNVLWTADGVALCTETSSQTDPQIVSDGAGGAIVAWTDGRNVNGDIYAQRISAAGIVQWIADGVVLCADSASQGSPDIASDGAGGAIVTWEDLRNTDQDIYAQWINGSGIVQWTADGIIVCAAALYQELPNIISDGFGGAIVTWGHWSILGLDIYAQRVAASGTVQWTADGVALCTAAGHQRFPCIASDGAGGAIVTWKDSRGSDDDLYAQRVNASGTIQWTPDGVLLSGAPDDEQNPEIMTDGNGGAIVTYEAFYSTWYDLRAQRVDSLGTIHWGANGLTLGSFLDDHPFPQIVPDGANGAVVTWLFDYDGIQDVFAQRIDSLGTILWPLDEEVCTSHATQLDNHITPDGANGAIVVWRDDRAGDYAIYVQRLNASGTAQWTTWGVLVCDAILSQLDARVVSDGAGGAIVTWQDGRSGSFEVYAQRVNASGTALWTEDGVNLCSAAGIETDPELIPDGTGGAIIAWRDSRGGSPDIYAQRINASGNVLWTADGVTLCAETSNQDDLQIVSDGAGGAIVTWQDFRGIETDIYAQRLNASGVVQWTTDGVALCAATGHQFDPYLTGDGASGAIVTWRDDRGADYDIYAQRIDASGTIQWTTDGVALCAATDDQVGPQVTSDGSGGAIVTWEDTRGTNSDIYAQRIDASGTVQWPIDGAAICTATGNQKYQKIVSDGAGGATVTWGDYRSSEWDIYSQRISNSGTVYWTPDGIPVCTATGTQDVPQITSDGSGGSLVAWPDERSGERRIYVQRNTTAGAGPICDVYPEVITIPDDIQISSYFDTSFTITNAGLGMLSGFVEETCADFQIVSGAGAYNLYGGNSHVVTVRFEPATTGSHFCTVETGIYLCSDVTISGTAYTCPPDSVLYVDSGALGANDGTSWMDAFTNLQDGLARSALCDNVTQVWVAEGTYYPTGGTDRTAAFALQDSLGIYGGFDGTETTLSGRDLLANTSVLSGDIGVAGDISDNSHHVVFGNDNNRSAVLDGFTVTGGNASAPVDSGGGVYLSGGSPWIENVIIKDNRALECGGGMFNHTAHPTLINVVFYNNTAGQLGGGMFSMTDNPVLVNCTFSRNYATDGGGGMMNEDNCNPMLVNVIMWGDSASYGVSEISNHAFSDPVISYSIIQGCGGSGGGWDPSVGVDGGNNLDTDPQFLDEGGGDLHLTAGSKAIDTGDSTASLLPSTDLDGNPRIQGTTVDRGAYEGEFGIVRIDIDTDPSHLEVVVDGDTTATPTNFSTRSGALHKIGTYTPQFLGEVIYSFTGWSDGGDTTHVIAAPDVDSTITASFTWAYTCAYIDSIVDVPADQGGWVRVYFRRSHYDQTGESQYPIERYDVHRRVDNPALIAAIMAEGKLHTKTGFLEYEGRYFVRLNDGPFVAPPPGLWEVVTTVSAQQQTQYIALAPTLADSAATLVYTAFYISAHSTTPAVFFDSPADSGYSVDNIAPGVPEGFDVAYNTGGGNLLTWDPCADSDFQYFKIYRGTDSEFVPGPSNEVHATADVSWNDPEYDGWNVHYKVTALDYVGNESPPASPGTTTGVQKPAIPDKFALYPNVPNPFNPVTVISYDVPAGGGLVTLRVYDVSGRLVRTLVDEPQAVGQKTATWNGTNDSGNRVATGVYFYRMTAPGFSQTRKMVLLK